MPSVGWWVRWTLWRRAQSREMLALIWFIVRGWKSFLGSEVEITVLELGKMWLAFSITALSDVATLSCSALRLFVPVCIRMWLQLSS